MIRPALLAATCLAALTIAGCQKPAPMSRADAAGAAACRSRADEIYLKQNRSLMSVRDQRDEPFAGSGISGNTTQGLGDLYGRDQMLASCLNSLGPAAPSGGSPATNTGPNMSPAAPGPDDALTPQ